MTLEFRRLDGFDDLHYELVIEETGHVEMSVDEALNLQRDIHDVILEES